MPTPVFIDNILTCPSLSAASAIPTPPTGQWNIGFTARGFHVKNSAGIVYTLPDMAVLTGSPHSSTSAANAAATITLATPASGQKWVIPSVWFSYSAAPGAGATLSIAPTSGTATVINVTSPGAGPMPVALESTTGVTITLSAGGAGVIGRVNASAKQVAV
jgi:hypothetical protein